MDQLQQSLEIALIGHGVPCRAMIAAGRANNVGEAVEQVFARTVDIRESVGQTAGMYQSNKTHKSMIAGSDGMLVRGLVVNMEAEHVQWIKTVEIVISWRSQVGIVFGFALWDHLRQQERSPSVQQ